VHADDGNRLDVSRENERFENARESVDECTVGHEHDGQRRPRVGRQIDRDRTVRVQMLAADSSHNDPTGERAGASENRSVGSAIFLQRSRFE
jgi:hypothetical protein